MNSPIVSKINWTQVIAAGASFGVLFGIDVPADQQLQIVVGIQAVQAVATVIFRTFFTAKAS